MSSVLPAATRGRNLTTKRVVQFVALALAVAAALVLTVLPVYSETTETSGGAESTRGRTLLEVNGLRFLIVLVIPVLIAGLPLATRGRAWQPLSIVSAVLLMGWVFVGMLSIGWFFLPAAIAAIIGACLSRHPRALPPASAA